MSEVTFVSIHELAERTGLPVAWLRDEARSSRLPYFRAGRRILFNLESVERKLLERACVRREDHDRGCGD